MSYDDILPNNSNQHHTSSNQVIIGAYEPITNISFSQPQYLSLEQVPLNQPLQFRRTITFEIPRYEDNINQLYQEITINGTSINEYENGFNKLWDTTSNIKLDISL